MVEHSLGKGEVHSSILCGSTIVCRFVCLLEAHARSAPQASQGCCWWCCRKGLNCSTSPLPRGALPLSYGSIGSRANIRSYPADVGGSGCRARPRLSVGMTSRKRQARQSTAGGAARPAVRGGLAGKSQAAQGAGPGAARARGRRRAETPHGSAEFAPDKPNG